MATNGAVRRALLSLSDKREAEAFAAGLEALGVEILSTGGTARILRSAGIAVTDIAAYTGQPELMDGRVKTLHPRIHGGILGRRGQDDAAMATHDIPPIDLVAVNLYPFSATVARPDCSFDEAIENIDIGGPTLLRAAAKNHRDVIVVVDPSDYPKILEALGNGGPDAAMRCQLAYRAFAHTAAYDAAIANWFSADQPDAFPRQLNLSFERKSSLRYGENPHQQAALYRDSAGGGITEAEQLQGKTLSYNNIADADAALACVTDFARPTCVIVKHANPCGVACGDELHSAYRHAYQCDPISAFGGILAFNRELDAALMDEILNKQFVEVIVAPHFSAAALQAAAAKPNLRLLACPAAPPKQQAHYQRIVGGLLVQDRDIGDPPETEFTTVSRRQPNAEETRGLHFAWTLARHVKSNAIVFARDERSLGIGAGQMSRLDSARIAVDKAADAGLELGGAVMASDAFFPFRDGLDIAAKHGIAAVIQPGGSQRDAEVIEAANEHDIAMLYSGVRHFRH